MIATGTTTRHRWKIGPVVGLLTKATELWLMSASPLKVCLPVLGEALHENHPTAQNAH
jgi:hypothetical protein